MAWIADIERSDASAWIDGLLSSSPSPFTCDGEDESDAIASIDRIAASIGPFLVQQQQEQQHRQPTFDEQRAQTSAFRFDFRGCVGPAF